MRRFGKHGASLVDRAHGVDADPVASGEPAKSIGHEHTFGHDTADVEVIERTVLGMADGVAWRLRAAGLRAATITLKLRDSTFATITRQTTLRCRPTSPSRSTTPRWCCCGGSSTASGSAWWG